MVRADPSHRRRDSSTARSDSSNVFGDRFAIDGSPTESTPDNTSNMNGSRQNSTASEDERTAVTSVAAHYADDSIRPTASRRENRNSVRKSRGYLSNPFNSDDEDGSSTRRPMLLRRSSDESYTADGMLSDRARLSYYTPSDYASGPSHDYSRYTQTTSLARSPSAPSTIIPQTTGRQSLHGPAHPYNMYPQNVDEDTIDDVASQAGENLIAPVGFPPRNLAVSRFRHDADNLSEQLPPYSEYPEDGAPKHVVESPRTSTNRSPLGVIPLLPVPQSMSDANHDVEVTSPTSDDNLIHHETKEWSQKSWKEKRKTKFCGIPFGWLVVVGGVLLFIVIVLSAAIGGFFGAQAKENGRANSGTLIDASPIRSSILPLPTGSYQLQLSSPQEVQSECLTDPTQSGSWDCGISAPGSLAISIEAQPGGGDGRVAFLYPANSNIPLGYGTQIPRTVQSSLRLVRDMDAPNRGPAFQFQAVYTKVVIAAPDLFQPAQVHYNTDTQINNSKRNQKRYWAPLAHAGDQPWVCYWNNTLIEGFIYVKENSTSWYSNSTSPFVDRGFRRHHNPRGYDSPESSATSTTTTGPTCTYSSGTMYGATPTDSTTVCPPAKGDDPWSQLDLYPFVVKVEERRIPGDTQTPLCRKMQVLDNGHLGTLVDPATGQEITQQVLENGPGLDAYTNVYGSSSRKRGLQNEKRATVNGACHCQWVSGEL